MHRFIVNPSTIKWHLIFVAQKRNGIECYISAHFALKIEDTELRHSFSVTKKKKNLMEHLILGNVTSNVYESIWNPISPNLPAQCLSKVPKSKWKH